MVNLKSVFGSNILHLAEYIIDIPGKVNNAYRHKDCHKHPMKSIDARPIVALTDGLLTKSVNGCIKYVEQKVDRNQHQAFADRLCRGIRFLQVHTRETYGIVNTDTNLSPIKKKIVSNETR